MPAEYIITDIKIFSPSLHIFRNLFRQNLGGGVQGVTGLLNLPLSSANSPIGEAKYEVIAGSGAPPYVEIMPVRHPSANVEIALTIECVRQPPKTVSEINQLKQNLLAFTPIDSLGAAILNTLIFGIPTKGRASLAAESNLQAGSDHQLDIEFDTLRLIINHRNVAPDPV